jgi:hypothetical protein
MRASPTGALRELARQAADAEMIDATTLSMSRALAGYIGAGALTRDPASTRIRYAAGRASR